MHTSLNQDHKLLFSYSLPHFHSFGQSGIRTTNLQSDRSQVIWVGMGGEWEFPEKLISLTPPVSLVTLRADDR